MIHREIRQRHRVSVDGNRSRPPWYEAPNSRQAAAGRPDPTQELVRPAGCRQAGLAGLAVAGRKQQLWLTSVILGVEPALLL